MGLFGHFVWSLDGWEGWGRGWVGGAACKAGAITSFQGTIRVGHFVHFASSLDGGEGWGRGGAGGAEGQGQPLLFKGQSVWGFLYIFLISRWGRRVRERRKRWSSCGAISIIYFLGTFCVGPFVNFVWSLDGGEGWGKVGAGWAATGQDQPLFFLRDDPCGAFCTFCLISRWGTKVRERRSRWSRCGAGSITFSRDNPCWAFCILEYVWSLDGWKGWGRGGAGGSAAGQGNHFFSKDNLCGTFSYILPHL